MLGVLAVQFLGGGSVMLGRGCICGIGVPERPGGQHAWTLSLLVSIAWYVNSSAAAGHTYESDAAVGPAINNIDSERLSFVIIQPLWSLFTSS